MGEIDAAVHYGDPDSGSVRTRGGWTDSLHSQRDHLTSVKSNDRGWGTSLTALGLAVKDEIRHYPDDTGAPSQGFEDVCVRHRDSRGICTNVVVAQSSSRRDNRV